MDNTIESSKMEVNHGTREGHTEIEIVSPLNCQVFQRDPDNRARIRVLVRPVADGDGMRARLRPDSVRTGQETGWVELTQSPEGWAGAIEASAGGWYVLELCAGGPVRTTPVRVGVGETFVVAGQSNASSSGGPPLTPQDDRVVKLEEGVWRLAADPRNPENPETGGSPWPLLGDMLAQSLQMPIGFVNMARGGSPTSWWMPPDADPVPGINEAPDEGSLFPRLPRAVRALDPPGPRLLLWHQGESDGQQGLSAEEHARRLTVIMETLDRDAGRHVPWMVAQAAYLVSTPPENHAQIRAGQRLLWERGLALQGPCTDDLTGPLYRRDGAHFTGLGVRVHAHRWFAMLWAQLYTQPALSGLVGVSET